MPKSRRPYGSEFIQEALRLVRESGKSRAQIAQDLGVSIESLRRWAMLYEKDGRQREVLPKTESDEIRQLRRELRVAHEEREILKKAAAFFAQEANRSR